MNIYLQNLYFFIDVHNIIVEYDQLYSANINFFSKQFQNVHYYFFYHFVEFSQHFHGF